MNLSNIKEIGAAKKSHQCSWCYEQIDAGSSYWRWRNWDRSDAWTVKMHPECHEAWKDVDDEWTPGDFCRGCCCERGGCSCRPLPGSQVLAIAAEDAT